MKKYYYIPISLFIFCYSYATIINIPADQPTIQAGINVAVDGDTVLVQPGTYFENIDFNGKDITVASLYITTQDTTYISQTIIDGNQNGSVVTFINEEDSTAVLTGFTITNGNSLVGGGIYCRFSFPNFENLTIVNNTAFSRGGGILCFVSNPYLENVTITNNSARFAGGISCQESDPTFNNVRIANNSASDDGGGICCHNYSNPSLENVTIANNSAYDKGGGIYCENNSSPSLVNVMISNNSADDGGGIWCMYNSHPSLVNCIMWNDTPEEVHFFQYYDPNTITIAYSDIEGGEAGIVTNNNGTVNWLEGNIDADPLFIDANNGDYHLTENSPCIDAGNPDPIYYDPEDPTNPGYALYPAMGTIINDMGAYGGPNAIGWPVVALDDNIIIQIPEIHLYQNYPNPFKPSGAGRSPATTIYFSLPENTKDAKIKIYNIKGQKVKTLYTSPSRGLETRSVIWNGTDKNNQPVSSGIYFYKLKAGDFEKTRKMILLK